MLLDCSKFKEAHDTVIAFVKSQTGINLNDYRDGDGTSPYTTTYWDKNGYKVCINWCGSIGGMDKNTQRKIELIASNTNNNLALEWGGAWFKYIYFLE